MYNLRVTWVCVTDHLMTLYHLQDWRDLELRIGSRECKACGLTERPRNCRSRKEIHEPSSYSRLSIVLLLGERSQLHQDLQTGYHSAQQHKVTTQVPIQNTHFSSDRNISLHVSFLNIHNPWGLAKIGLLVTAVASIRPKSCRSSKALENGPKQRMWWNSVFVCEF
jgi:hypothetical protein